MVTAVESSAPTISIVVPVFNGEVLLPDCLQSVLDAVAALSLSDQECVELVVCDNHSTDASGDVIRRYQPACRLRVVRPPQHEANRTRNWAFGIAMATGTWCMMLHHDDRLAGSGLRTQLEAARSGPAARAAMIVGRHRTFARIDAPSALRPRFGPTSLVPGSWVARGVLPLHCPFVPFALFRMSAYRDVGGLDSEWQLVQDWDLWTRLLSRGALLSHGGEVGWWRLHETSTKYRQLNAVEHLRLANRASAQRPLAIRTARARAAINLADLDAISSETAIAVAGEALPGTDEARRSLGRIGRRVAVTLATLRATGALRLKFERARDR